MARQYERMVHLVRALLGPGALALGLGLAAVAAAATSAVGGAGMVVQVAFAATVAVVTVGLVARRWRRDVPRRSTTPRRATRAACLAVLLVAGSAAVVFGVDAAAGGIRVLGVDVGALATFLLLNTVIALVMEALPEELALRGYTFGVLAAGGRTVLAGVLTTALFVVTPGVGTAIGAVLGDVLGLPTPPATFAPAGQDPVAYAVLLGVFGAMLVTVRAITGSVAACVAAHLTVLTVNRIVLDPSGARTGVAVGLPPGGEVLVLGYLALAMIVALVASRLIRAGAARRPAAPAAVPARR